MSFPDFITFLNKCTCPSAYCKISRKYLLKNEYEEINENNIKILPKKGFLIRNERSLIAYNIGGLKGSIIAAAHSDSPSLKYVPYSEFIEFNCKRVKVISYAGGLTYSWFGRELKLSGSILIQEEEKKIWRFFDSKESIAFIPFINYNDNNNQGFSMNIDREKHLNPIISSYIESIPIYISKKLNISINSIIDMSLYFSIFKSPNLISNSILTNGRLDNLTSSYSCLKSFLSSNPQDHINIISIFDHEEIGSGSHWGACGDFLEKVLKLISKNFLISLKFLKLNSLIISADASHTNHPNFLQSIEKNHPIYPLGGVVVKASGQTPTGNNIKGVFFIKETLELFKIPFQFFSKKGIPSTGGTIGPKMDILNNILTIDIGIPVWGMHSSRETMALKDLNNLIKLFECLFENYQKIKYQYPIE